MKIKRLKLLFPDLQEVKDKINIFLADVHLNKIECWHTTNFKFIILHKILDIVVTPVGKYFCNLHL